MRADVQEIFKRTPHDKQVMMFSATLSDTIKPICKKFMNNVRGQFWIPFKWVKCPYFPSFGLHMCFLKWPQPLRCARFVLIGRP